MKKIIGACLLGIFLVGSANAGEFIPENPVNKFTERYYWAKCGLSSDTDTSSSCPLSTSSSEFKEKNKIANWYNEFDFIMRFRLYEEIIWDYDWQEWEATFGFHETYREERAYEIISDHTSSFEFAAMALQKSVSYTEDDLKFSALNVTQSTFQKIKTVAAGFGEVDDYRSFLVNNGHLDATLHQRIYPGTIDELVAKIEEVYYSNSNHFDEEKIEKFENVFYPNILKLLELEKEWTQFYRDASQYKDSSLKTLGYSDSDIARKETGTLDNTYANKADFEEEIQQTIGSTILDGDLPKRQIGEVSGNNTSNETQTLGKINAQRFGKNYEDEYGRLDDIMGGWFQEFRDDGGTQGQVNILASSLSARLPDLIDGFEVDLKNSSTSQKENLNISKIWVLSVLIDVLENEN